MLHCNPSIKYRFLGATWIPSPVWDAVEATSVVAVVAVHVEEGVGVVMGAHLWTRAKRKWTARRVP